MPKEPASPDTSDSVGTLALIRQWLGGKWSAAANVIKSLGPTIVSVIPAASRQILKHRATADALELAKEVARAEQKLISEARAQILEGADNANPAELLAIRQRLDFIDEQTRSTNIHLRALETLEEKTQVGKASKTEELPSHAEVSPITDHWTDHFNRFARLRNEPWRTELLARALAAEANNPGSISVRALWTIGTLETNGFEAFASFLDLSMLVDDNFIVPKLSLNSDTKLPKPEAKEPYTIGSMLFQVDALGLLGPMERAIHVIFHGETPLSAYGSTAITLEPIGKEFTIDCIITNQIGKEIGSLYDRVPNSVGQAAFDSWKASISPEVCKVTPVSKPAA